MANLSKVAERNRLKVRREPHWQRLHEGCFLVFRASKRGGIGTWIARAYDPDNGKYKLKSLGDLGSLPAHEMFRVAKKEAEAFAELIEAGGSVSHKIETVADACREYAKDLPEADARFRRYVYPDPIAKVKLSKLRRRHTREWRARLAEIPAQVSRRKTGEKLSRTRSPSTVNRDVTPLRAALRKVLPAGAPNSEAAWQEPLTPTPNVDGRRHVYLHREQRRNLLAQAADEVRPFLRALCLLPLRPGAVAKLAVADFNVSTAELTVKKDKSGKSRRIKLPKEAKELFFMQSKNKLPSAPLFMRANGKSWGKDSWKKPFAAAVARAKLPKEATAYSLRHSTITDLVNDGLPLLTIAQISDTSVVMIERHYGHLVGDAAEKALGNLSL